MEPVGEQAGDLATAQPADATEAPAAVIQPAPRVSWFSVAGWVSYDLGNTVFSFNIISIYLPLWVVNDMGGQDVRLRPRQQHLDGR